MPSHSSAAARRGTYTVSEALRPWRVAARVFTPAHRVAPPDRGIEVRRLLRAWISVGIVLWTLSQYGFDYRDAAHDLAGNLTAGLTLALLLVPLTARLLTAAAAPEDRVGVRLALALPLRRVALFAGTILLVLAGLLAADVRRDALSALVIYPPLLWLLVFFAASSWFVVRHQFAGADGHLLLPSLTGALIPWALACATIGGSPEGGSTTLGVALCGAVIASALSVSEHLRIRDVYAVTLRHPFPQARRR